MNRTDENGSTCVINYKDMHCTCHGCHLQARREALEALVTERHWILSVYEGNQYELNIRLDDNAARIRALGE